MKKIFINPLIFIFLFFPISPVYSSDILCKTTGLSCEKVNIETLIPKNGIMYKKFTDTPFTGISTGLLQGKWIDGKQDGEFLVFHPDGWLFKKMNFKLGIFNGTYFEYFENGNLRVEQNVINGELDGVTILYTENGSIYEKINYKNGERDGPYETWWFNTDGSGTCGIKEKGSYINGLKEGFWTEYDVLRNDCKSKSWESGNYKNDKREGPWTTFYSETGEKKVVNYQNGNVVWN